MLPPPPKPGDGGEEEKEEEEERKEEGEKGGSNRNGRNLVRGHLQGWTCSWDAKVVPTA